MQSPVSLHRPLDRALSAATGTILPPSIEDPSINPQTAFGLTYWSTAPLTSITGETLSSLSSLILIALLAAATALLLLNHKSLDWRGLIFSQLLYLSAVFLSLRIVEEHWFIWILPHLTLLSQSQPNNQKPWGLYALSLTALAYSLVNSQILAFFTPTAAFTTLPPAFPQARLLGMAILGTLFSILLILHLIQTGRNIDWRYSSGQRRKN